VTEWKSHEGYDAQAESFAEKHPTLAKAVDIGKKAVGVVNKKSTEYLENVQKSEQKFKEMQGEREEEPEEKKPSKKSKKSKSKILDEEDFDFDKDEDITALHKATSKQKVLPGSYKTVYGGGMGKSGYEPVYKTSMGTGTYQSAYKPKIQKEQPEELTDITQIGRKRVKSTVEELTPRAEQIPEKKIPDRFNMQNWQSLGFPNTLPQSARGSLFRPAQQQPVIPMVRQPYQPRAVPTPAPQRHAPMSGPMPRIGLNINTTPQIMKPRTTITPPRASSHVVQKTAPAPAPMTFMGVTLGGEKKKQEPNKPITRMGEGYKNTPLVVMNSLYPTSGYNPNKDSITKKSIIPKIRATVSPNDFTMFGLKVKNKKN
jgi:hypothetical protein